MKDNIQNSIYESVFDSIPDLIIIINRNFKIINANKSLLQKIQKSRDEIVGKTCYSVFHNSQIPPIFCPCFKVFSDGEELKSDYYDVHTNSWYRVNTIPLKQEDDSFNECIHIAQELNSIELSSYNQHNRKVSSIINNNTENINQDLYFSNSIVIRYDIDLNYTIINTANYDDFLNSLKIKSEFSTFINTIDNFCKHFIPKVIKDTAQFSFEFMLPQSNNNKYFITHFIPELNSNNQIISVLVITHDVSYYKEREIRLKESEARYNSLINSTNDMIWAIDKNCKIIIINNSMIEIFKNNLLKNCSEYINYDEFINKETQKIFKYYYELAFNGEKQLFTKLIFDRIYEIEIAPIIDNNGRIQGVGALAFDISEKQQILEALKISESNYKRLIDNLGEGLAIVDEEEYVLFTNNTCGELFGVDTKDLLGSHLTDFTNDENKSILIEQTKLRKQGIKSTYELEIIRKDNTKAYLLITATPDIDFDNKYLGSLMIFHDMTKRKLIQLALIDSEERNRTIIETSRDGIWQLNQDAQVIDVNKRLADMLGYSIDEMKGQVITKFVDSENSNNALHYLERRIQGVSEQYDFKFLHKNGNTVWTIISATPVFNQNNEFLYSFAMITDITERKATEKLLEETEKKYKVLIESADDAIILFDKKYNILLDNDSNYSIHGYTKEEGIHLFDFSIIHCDDVENLKNSMKQIYRLGKVTNEYRIKHKNGDWIYIYSKSVLIKNNSGEIKYILSILRDLTEIKKTEQELHLYTEELKQNKILLENRTIELNELNNKLQEAIESKDKFFSIMAHDLKSPFSGFLGISELLAKEFDELSIQEIEELSNTLHQSAHRLYGLIEDLLQWSRTQIGTMPFEPIDFDLYDVVENTIYLLKKNADIKNTKIINTLSYSTNIKADRNMINAVVRNLISNAIKFTSNGTITIELERTPESIIFSCIDTGIGIKPQDIGNLFNVGSNFTTIGTANERGTGLGLILANEFITLHCGKIWVESELGKGSVFKFELPQK